MGLIIFVCANVHCFLSLQAQDYLFDMFLSFPTLVNNLQFSPKCWPIEPIHIFLNLAKKDL